MKKFVAFTVAVGIVLTMMYLLDMSMFDFSRNKLFWDAERSAQEEGQKVAKEILGLGRPSITFAPWIMVAGQAEKYGRLFARTERIYGFGSSERPFPVIEDALTEYAFGLARQKSEQPNSHLEAYRIARSDSGFRYAIHLSRCFEDIAGISSAVLKARTWRELEMLRKELEALKDDLDYVIKNKEKEINSKKPKTEKASLLMVV